MEAPALTGRVLPLRTSSKRPAHSPLTLASPSEAVAQSHLGKAAPRSRKYTPGLSCGTTERLTLCVRRRRWPLSEPTLRNDRAGSPGVCATASPPVSESGSTGADTLGPRPTHERLLSWEGTTTIREAPTDRRALSAGPTGEPPAERVQCSEQSLRPIGIRGRKNSASCGLAVAIRRGLPRPLA